MIVPGSLLVITTFFLTREITQSDRASLFTAFMSAVSFQLLIGMFAGFYANLLALSFGYLSFLFMFKLLRSAELRPSYLAAFIVSFVLLYLSHTYSWTIFAIVTAILLAIFFFKGKQKRGAYNIDLADRGSKDEKPRVILLISIVLVAVLVTDIGRSMFTGTQSGIGRDLAIAEESSGATQFLTRWDTIQDTVFVFGGGITANIIVLGLGLYWLFRSNPQLLASVLLMLFLAAGMIPLVLGDWIVQSRVLFNIPFHIPAGIALSMILAKPKNGRVFLILAVCIWLVAESIISVSNFPGQGQ